MPPRSDARRRVLPALAVVAAAAGAAALPALLGRQAAAIAMNALIAAVALTIVILAERRARRSGDEAFGWRCLALAGALGAAYRSWSLASVAATGSLPSFPGAAQQYLQPLLLLVVSTGLLAWASRGRNRLGGIRSALDGFLFGTSLLFVLWAYMTHQADWQTQLTRVQQVVIAVDLSVIAASLGLFAHLVSSVMPQVAGPLAFVGAALLGAGVYGLAMTLLSAGGGYYVGHPMDMFALITAGMIALATLTPGAVIPDAAARPLVRRAPVASLLPYLPLVASLFTAALLLGRADTEGDRFLTALGVTLGIALLLRQQLALRDVERLSHHLTETVMMRTHELARAQAALARAQRLEAVGRMAGGIARDFDRLIAELEAPVAILGGAIPATHPDREAVEEIAAAGRRAQRLTAQLLTFAQRQPVEPRHVDVNTVLGDALPLLRQLAGRAIAVELRHAPAPATVFADPTQLEQLLSNLTVNARDAMPDGGTLTIAVTLPGEEEPPPPDGPHGRRVRIVVQDTGVGIDEETLAHVFEPFFTTKPAGKGTGLGLSTCYGIVNRAGGRIVVESARGAGTTVMVELPRTG